ncbi:hypothetical protein OL229_10770 [Neisseriaceae bacterium JH1-16]|nr:hypothetical protein [Neisseriaceae bacterium JH1-16]
MAVIFENDGSTPLGLDDVDGMAEFLEPDNDIGPTWDPEVDDFPAYLGDLSVPSQTDRAAALHGLLDSHGGPEGMVELLSGMDPDQRTALIAGLARLGGVSAEHVEHHLLGDPSGAADYLAQLDTRHDAQTPAALEHEEVLPDPSTVHADVLVAELKADLMEAILDDPVSPEVDRLILRLATALR